MELTSVESLWVSVEEARAAKDQNRTIALCSAILAADPLDARALFIRGLARLAQEDFVGGAADFAAVQSCRPDDDNAGYNLGLCLVKLGQTARARTAFEQYLQRHPGDADAESKIQDCIVSEPTGRDMLTCVGRVLATFGAVGLCILLLIYVALPLLGKEGSVAGYAVMAASVIGMLIAARFAIEAKVRFIVVFWSWFFQNLFSMRRGRVPVGLCLFSGGAWIGGTVLMDAWRRTESMSGSRFKEFLAAMSLAAVGVVTGAILVAVGLEEWSSPSDGPDR